MMYHRKNFIHCPSAFSSPQVENMLKVKTVRREAKKYLLNICLPEDYRQ